MTAQTIESNWGRESITVDGAVPVWSIQRLQGHVHVSVTDPAVEADWTRRLDKLPAPTTAEEFEAAAIFRADVLRFAVWCHHENRAEYAGVMGAL